MTAATPRVCVYSQRGLHDHVSRCLWYEFEDVIAEVDDIDLMVASPTHFFELSQKVSNRASRHFGVLPPISGVRPTRLDHDYELFFALFASPSDIPTVKAVREWRKHCEIAVCWVDEIWKASTGAFAAQLAALAEFDAVVLSYAGSVHAVQRLVDAQCYYLPLGVDTIRFCPHPRVQARSVDVYSMGRRVPRMHAALLDYASVNGKYYVYDTLRSAHARNWSEHRRLIAETAKRSKYFVVLPAKFNQDGETQGQREIGSRYYEGAAAGAALIGKAPEAQHWKAHFDWPDAVLEFPEDPDDLRDWIEALDDDTTRLESLRRRNTLNSLRRNDWAYRWEMILKLVGMEVHSRFGSRLEHIDALAKSVNAPTQPTSDYA